MSSCVSNVVEKVHNHSFGVVGGGPVEVALCPPSQAIEAKVSTGILAFVASDCCGAWNPLHSDEQRGIQLYHPVLRHLLISSLAFRPSFNMESYTARLAGPKLKECCDLCSVSKLRCNKQKPTCARRASLNQQCSYSPARRSGRPHRGQREKSQQQSLVDSSRLG